MGHGGGGGHGGHHGGGGGGYYSGFRPIFPLFFYPMMGYWLYRQNYYIPPQQSLQPDPFVDFAAKLSFNLERSSSGFALTEQTVVQEEISNADFASKLEGFLRESDFRRVIALSVDRFEIYRRDLLNSEEEQASDNLGDSFSKLREGSSAAESISIETYSHAGNFRSTLDITFTPRHPASRYSVDCSLNAVPQVYFRKKTESERDSAARISRFSAMMLDSIDRSSFVVQERDLLIPVLRNLASLFAATFRVRNGWMQISLGRDQAPIWRSNVAP